ncbi:hypothetical protein B5F07_09845 [Lachnoclostridium sp. An169]|uniref:hypothetical protein n=1 Tax=Lachnoclostridium sp. An169 TaxID=1965569 RepID=UPI000B3996EC|nr:hypothetical protein [Lachnoclostridium sp. An169]OUP83569.1 hypothetical protein B5F07_09845 [Lachnoclostridium sp. An169]
MADSTNIHPLSARRRALNIIWTAAGEYGFDPVFMAFTQDGEPDFYMDSIIGYVHKWYDRSVMEELFDTLALSMLKETFDGLLWIALENCTFEREVKERPVLSELRTSCAETFFRQQLTRSRQQWMAQNSLVYALQEARWRTVLGKAPGLVNPRENRLFGELAFHGDMTAEEISNRFCDILRRYFHFDRECAVRSPLLKVRRKIDHILSRALPSKVMRAEDLSFGASDITGSGLITARKGKDHLLSAAEEQNNRIYIENCFGLSLYNEMDSAQTEHELCTGNHQNCHLYFTAGERGSSGISDALIRKTVADAKLQAERNRRHFQEKRRIYQNSIRQLAAQIENALLVYPQPLKVRSRMGRLAPGEIWRAVRLGDERVFTDTFEEEEPDFSVDLMLDGSASRLQSQEVIAAQGYIIARSLHLCGIPAQVYSFLSLRGYTVMRLFSSYTGNETEERIFDYFAAGWNRDGLALRGASHLMQASPARNRLLILLTDASPNDDRKIPANPSEGHYVSRDYSGEAGIEDTAAEVRALRKSGIHVMAVLNGEEGSTEAARKIYGDDFARIGRIEDLSNAVGLMIQKQIEQMRM